MITIPLRSGSDRAGWRNDTQGRTLGIGVVEEQLHDVDVLGAGEGVTADTDDERLAKANTGRLRDGLVGERARTRDDTCGIRQSRTLLARWTTRLTNAAGRMDNTGLDTHLATSGVNDARTVGSDETRLGLALEGLVDLHSAKGRSSSHGRHANGVK